MPAPTDTPSRLCARPSCATAATATMTYDYVARTAWLDPLDASAEPHGYDLCRRHADGTGVPVGWSRVDRRLGQLALDDVLHPEESAPADHQPGAARPAGSGGPPIGGRAVTNA